MCVCVCVCVCVCLCVCVCVCVLVCVCVCVCVVHDRSGVDKVWVRELNNECVSPAISGWSNDGGWGVSCCVGTSHPDRVSS